jgi:FkbM family methyltransferase
MNPLKIFLRPEYLFRPRQILHRLKRVYQAPKPSGEIVVLPWGDSIKVFTNEVIGSGIWCYGVFDLIVGEAILRLLDKGETALDIGANIGQFSTLMARRVGLNGKVFSFEPHSDLYHELVTNCSLYINIQKTLRAHNSALGKNSGSGTLIIPKEFGGNRGTSKVGTDGPKDGDTFKIKIETLDEVCEALRSIGVCKIDVEGHEAEVLKGAARTLRQKKIRDIIYEDVGLANKELRAILIEAGYTIFSLHTDIIKPRISALAGKKPFKKGQEGENFVATLEPDRAIRRFNAVGWKTLRKLQP